MRVQRVLMPGTEFESWTVLGDDQMPVEPVERFLAYLVSIEKSPNTVKAYAHDLKDWLTYLDRHGVDWRIGDVGGRGRVRRLAADAAAGPGRQGGGAADGGASLFGGQREPQARRADVVLRIPCPAWRRVGGVAGHHAAGEPARRARRRPTSRSCTTSSSASRERRRDDQAEDRPKPRRKYLPSQQVQTILDACEHLRDRLLFALLLDTGVRIGEALGLRHEDIDIAGRVLTVRPRSNDNRARAKAGVAGRSRPARS